jgi:lysophospholipase L1-like esterase
MEIIACLGSSTTAGKGEAYNWIGVLQTRPQNKNRKFFNFGVGGDLAYGALQRIPEVIACHPDTVIVQVGGNDVLVRVFANARRFLVDRKHLAEPTLERFHESVRAIVCQLKEKTRAKIALVSLQPIGEDPNSSDPIQKELNALVEQYSGIIREIAQQENVAYLPLYEALRKEILKEPGKAFTKFRFLSFYKDAFRYFILRKSGDEIAKANGWHFHVDGVHLNSRSGKILADLAQAFLDRENAG